MTFEDEVEQIKGWFMGVSQKTRGQGGDPSLILTTERAKALWPLPPSHHGSPTRDT